MFYSVASPDWKPGQPLNPSGALLFRSRTEAESFAPEASAVEVAVRFDERRQVVRPRVPVHSSTTEPWVVPAVANVLGGVTVFGAIPAALVRPTIEVEVEGVDPSRAGTKDESNRSPRSGFGGWDSLTMALLA